MPQAVWPIPRVTTQTIHVPAADTAAVVTLAAVVGQRHVVRTVGWSYSAAPTGGRLTIADDGTTKHDLDITAGGPGFIAPEYVGGVGKELVITVAAGGGAVVGKLSVAHYLAVDAPTFERFPYLG